MLSPQKKYLLDLIDSLKPFEKVIITADKEGKANRYLVQRSQSVMVTEIEIKAVPC